MADIIRAAGNSFIERNRILADLAAPESAARHRALPHGSARRPSSTDVPAAAIRPSPTTPAATAIARSARPTPATSGWRSGPKNCCPSPTSTSSSRFRTTSPRWPCRTRKSSTTCCSAPAPRPCWRSPPIRSISGAEIGFLSVLHTWGQNLQHHPHVHCVIPAGGLSPDHTRWIHPRYPLLPARSGCSARVPRASSSPASSALFRTRKLAFPGALNRHWPSQGVPLSCARCSGRTGWSTPKRPSADRSTCSSTWPATRIASPSPTTGSSGSTDGKVTFRWKDYAHGNKKRKMTVTADEFLRRFLLHVLPRGFTRIRHFGLLANRRRAKLVPLCRRLLADAPPRPPNLQPIPVSVPCWTCPRCSGPMVLIEKLTAQRDWLYDLLNWRASLILRKPIPPRNGCVRSRARWSCALTEVRPPTIGKTASDGVAPKGLGIRNARYPPPPRFAGRHAPVLAEYQKPKPTP